MIVLSFLLVSSFGYSEEESGSSFFSIKSKTDLISPQCIIDSGDQEEDRKRTNVGIGETLHLVVSGKALSDKKAVVEWTLNSGGELATLEKDDEDDKSAILAIKKDARSTGSVTVEAKAKKNGIEIATTTISFETKLPTGIDAEHSGLRVDGHPPNGDTVNVGASSCLILILKPLTVSFRNIQIKEKAEDTDSEVGNNWIGEHVVGDVAGEPNDRNEVRYDRIGVKGATVIGMQGWSSFGVESIWRCGWYTSSNGVNHHKISGQNYEQVFVISEDGVRPVAPSVQEIKASVSKFGRTVTRSTAGIAFHEDL